MRTDEAWQIQGADIKFKCLKCKDQWDEDEVTFTLTPILKTDKDGNEEFFCFEVFIADENGGPQYLQDPLCYSVDPAQRRMSVFGRTSTAVFAFPCLEFVTDTLNVWVSHPDSNKSHLAIKGRV